MTKEIVRPGSAGRLPAIAAVTVLVVLGAVLVDRAIHDPPCRDGAAAVAVVEREALPALEELPAGEDYALEAGEPETIGENSYYPVTVSRVVRCRDGEAAKRVIEVRVAPHLAGVAPYVYDFVGEVTREGELYYEVKFGTIWGDARDTFYVRARDSQPFYVWEDGTMNAEPSFPEDAEPPVLTVYVRARDSRPFLRDGTTGQLIPYGG